MSKLRKEQTEMIHIRMPLNIKRQIEELRANRRGQVNQTQVILAALRDFFDPDEANKKEIALLRRLNAIDRQLTHLKVQNEVIAEAFAAFIKNYFRDTLTLRMSTGITEGMLNTARGKTDALYQKYLERLSNTLNLGGEFFRRIPDQIFEPGQFAQQESRGDEVVINPQGKSDDETKAR